MSSNTQSCVFQSQLEALFAEIPEAQSLVESLFVLSCCGEQLVAPIFARTDAVGSVMRRKLEPVISPITAHIGRLQGKS